MFAHAALGNAANRRNVSDGQSMVEGEEMTRKMVLSQFLLPAVQTSDALAAAIAEAAGFEIDRAADVRKQPDIRNLPGPGSRISLKPPRPATATVCGPILA